mmetsp:Transcript_25896/g.54681  ORF Transcript_25896/g.54681 Transcript_25896/m.54681 type:complete len:224 (-) Transcript_25896:145-816(-)
MGHLKRRVSELRHTSSSPSLVQPCCFASSARTRDSAASRSQRLTPAESSLSSRGWVRTIASAKSEIRSSLKSTLNAFLPCFRLADMFCGTSRRLCPSSGGFTAKTSESLAKNCMECGQAWHTLVQLSLTMRTSMPSPSRRHWRSSGKSRVKSSLDCVITTYFKIPTGSTTRLKGSMTLKRQHGHQKLSGLSVYLILHVAWQRAQRKDLSCETKGTPAEATALP